MALAIVTFTFKEGSPLHYSITVQWVQWLLPLLGVRTLTNAWGEPFTSKVWVGGRDHLPQQMLKTPDIFLASV